MTDSDFMTVLYAGCCAGVNIAFAFVWWFAKRRDNWSLVDAFWSLSAPFFAAAALVGSPSPRCAVVVALLFVWGGRLALHLHGRVGGGRDREDARYSDMRKAHGPGTPGFMFGFFQLQAVTIWVLMLPAFTAAADPSLYPQWYDIVGAIVVLAAVSGETLADIQLRRFKADASNRGGVCDVGLWAYSRHPNYFCEWLVWVGFAVTASGSPYGWVAWSAPVMMYVLLRHVSGVPIAEARAGLHKGEVWRAYAARVPVFFPGRPRPR